MAYNPFPVGYQPYYYQSSQPVQSPVTPSNSNNGIIWVQGENAARAYLVAPNSTVQLWDSDAQVIYLKSADASGMPSIKTLDYTIRDMPSQQAKVEYATKAEVDALRDEVNAIRNGRKERTDESSLQHDGEWKSSR